MNAAPYASLMAVFALHYWAASSQSADAIYREVDGVVAVEAEHFAQQTATETRAFHLATGERSPDVEPDGDPTHIAGASGGAYLEALPDTRRAHNDKLIRGENFSPLPGKMAILHYRVHFTTPGRYYVWARAHSTGPEDNGLHVGLDGEWPASGQRLQWCEGKRTWWWDSKQRTDAEHCGEPHKIYLDIDRPGEHTIQFSMREDGFEFDKWLMTTDRDFARPDGVGSESVVHSGQMPKTFAYVAPDQSRDDTEPAAVQAGSPTKSVSDIPLQQPRQTDGDGSVKVTGELKQWHKITLSQDGPFAHEQDNQPNPFTDQRMTVTFKHADGTEYVVPGYFAADGIAANTSAEAGTIWRAHFAPDRTGEWTYAVSFHQGPGCALEASATSQPLAPYDGRHGSFSVAASDKQGRDLRAHGRLQYVGERYLKFAGSGEYFLKAGADAPETLLGYADFDNTIAGNPRKSPLKTWQPHLRDWREGDSTWQDGKGKGLIGAVNYLSGKGCNAFSFLTYNAGGDGDNVWPFVHRDDKLHYDCSKLDQWGIVFDHATARGMYLHFKMQETEMDDDRHGDGGSVPESLDGGKLGPQRRLYCRELIARFGHNLAINWNLGEENTQSTSEQIAMLEYIADLDPYDHNRVVHTYPNRQEAIYRPLLGDRSKLTGVSLQNSHIKDTHSQTVKWVEESTAAGKPWIVAFDESGSAAHGQCPDLGYEGYDGRDRSGKMTYTQHEVRRQTLWGQLMGGGAGVEYYFGYQYVQNDLVCEDWRSRDQSWDYCRIAIEFFHEHDIPFWQMAGHDELVGNPEHDNSVYCLAKPGEIYLVYLPEGGQHSLDLAAADGAFAVKWFNPRTGGALQSGSTATIEGRGKQSVGEPPTNTDHDWLAVVRKQN
jgi:hypothetical protein